MRKKTEAPPVPQRTLSVLEQRFPVVSAGKQFLRKVFPDHWSFLLGEIALYSFVVLLFTGVFLTLFFHPDMTEKPYTGSYAPMQGVRASQAFTSVLDISFDVRGGLLVRQVHHWAALIFVAAVGCHLLRIFFTGAFRRPREGNWMIGVTLFLLALLEGFCGYSLPDDLLSGTGLRTAQGIILSVPVIGSYLNYFIFGDGFPGHEIIPRLFTLHILLIPGLIIALISAHLSLVVNLKHTQWYGPGRTNANVKGKPLFPQYAAKSIGLFLTVAGVTTLLAGLLQINPIWHFGPSSPEKASVGSQPDWYVGFLEGALRVMPAAEVNLWGHTIAWSVFIPGALVPLVLFAVLYAYPFFEGWLEGGRKEHHLDDRPRNQPTRTGLGVAGVTFYAVLLAAGGQDVIGFKFGLPVEALTWLFRVSVVVLPVCAYLAAKRLCLGLQAQDRVRLKSGRTAGIATRTAAGGYQEERAPLSEEETYQLLVRDTPRPGPAGKPVRGIRLRRLREGVQKFRTALSHWYFGQRVELPATPKQRRKVRSALQGPEKKQHEET